MKILLAMSGGVDSSVAAALLRRDGHEVVGCFMRLGSPGEELETPIADGACPTGAPRARIGHQGCCSINDAADARLVAARLGIPFYVVNFRNDFGRIIRYFEDEYHAGRTPNPCVRCNDWLKFGKLDEYAAQIGAQAVASGHYARIDQEAGEWRLRRGLDESKDQSYVLFGVPRERLDRLLFPVGGLPKAEVRALARQWGLPVFDKPDSQEICFVPDNDYASLVDRRRPDVATEGPIVDESGRVVGTHRGQHRFTIGQRRGLDVALGERAYVIAKNAATNTVVIGPRERLLCAGCEAGEANWLVADPGEFEGREVMAKFRYNTPPTPARFRRLPGGPGPTHSGRTGRFAVEFLEPQVAVATGQALVLHDGDRVIGGGWIDRAG